MRRHEKDYCSKLDVVGGIINKVSQRAGFDAQPTKVSTPVGGLQRKTVRPTTKSDVPMEAINFIKPKSLTQLAIEQESEETDSEESEANSEDGSMDIELTPENPTQLMKAFRNLYTKFDDNIRRLLLVLEELERINCLSSEECKGMKYHLRNKIEE